MNEQRDIFWDDEDRNSFISLMGEMKGRFTNQVIAELFGLTYSSVNRRVGIVRKQLREDKPVKDKLDHVNALIKM